MQPILHSPLLTVRRKIRKRNMRSKKILIAIPVIAFALILEPTVAEAGNSVSVKQAIQQAGVTDVLTAGMTTEEEYIQMAAQAEGSLWGYTNLGIANVENNLNVRQQPDESGKLVGKMPKDSACEVLETADNWAHIQSGEVEGYVCMDYLFTGVEAKLKAMEVIRTVAVVNVDGLRIRKGPSVDSEVMTQVPEGAELEYAETVDGWHKVLIDGQEAYVSAEYADVTESLNTAITLTELLYGQGVSDVRVDLVEYSKQFLGNPYVWGGTSLTKGADCSGFVVSIFKNFGVKLSHSSRAQANEGTKISMDKAQPGDLIFYGSPIDHVAIYIGGGKVIHASSPTTGIIISKYNYRTPVKVVKVLKD